MKAIIRRIVLCAAVAFAAGTATGEPKEPLGLYVVRGSAAQLERFHAEIAKDWQGGEFVGRLSSKTEFRYWAYPTRTAHEARAFMFGSMEHGLRLDIEEYDEATFYPKERALLDEIASTCGVEDPFQIRPNRTLLVQPNPEISYEDADCILTKLKKADFGEEMPIGLVGYEAGNEQQ